MSDTYYISTEALPVSQNFKLLKEEGLAYIQEISGNEWTNLNPSDPGVTILDQVCYALTELGYCNDFPIKDILTHKDDKLKTKHQFYLPDKILTTSPLTLNDYRKYVIDGIKGVRNLMIEPVKVNNNVLKGVYKTYIAADMSLSEDDLSDLPKAVFYLLNTSRNLTELFLMPKLLTPKTYQLSGRIDIEDINNLKQAITQIQEDISNFIFPQVPQYGYHELKNNGVATNDIFEGPILQNGWIQTADLGDKKNEINAVDINKIIAGVKGVKLQETISFTDNTSGTNSVKAVFYEILQIDIPGSLQLPENTPKEEALPNLLIYYNNKRVEGNELDNAIAFAERMEKVTPDNRSVTTAKLKPGIPKGTYRDINTYYSIQNTFPEMYPVGLNAINDNAPNTKKAQSRQLQGYLTLFDQVLANQFSQLANIHKLFSFKNTMTGTPSDMKNFYELKDHFEKKHPGYPVPFITFSATYFYQSLYNIPNIRTLLKGYESFNFSFGSMSDKELEEASWKAYQNDPYNAYIWGIKMFISDANTNYERRNRILDHLLSRQGESPLIIDALILGAGYTLDNLQDKVIVKSLYLQNLERLSYYRLKGYNYQSAQKIPVDSLKNPFPEKKPKHKKDQDKKQSKPINPVPESLYEELLQYYQSDFIFNTKKTDHIEKLHVQDFIDYSALELKLNMLLSLRVQYNNFIVENYDDYASTYEKLHIALWMTIWRKGSIVIEPNLLLQPAQFQATISETNDEKTQYWSSDKQLPFADATALGACINAMSNEDMKAALKAGQLEIEGTTYTLSGPESHCDWNDNWFHPTKEGGYKLAVKVSWNDKVETYISDPVFNGAVDVFFPDFIEMFSTPAFDERMQLFFDNSLPVRVEGRYHLVSEIWLLEFISKFIAWHSAMRYKEGQKQNDKALLRTAGFIAEKLMAIIKKEKEENGSEA